MKASDMAHNFDETFNRLKSDAQDGMDKVAHATGQAADALTHKGEQLYDVEQQALKNCRGHIQNHPIASVGVAVGVGFLISRLLYSR